jgi:AcrR family transcriptional regulator
MARLGTRDNTRDALSAPATLRTGHERVAATLGRRRLAPDDRRAELIDAAISVLRTGVYEGNWVAEVTRAAGAAKGTFYVYFPSWEDMLAVVREHLIDECNEPIRDALAAADGVDWWAVLEDQCGRFVDVVTEFGRHHALIFHSVLPHDPGGASRSGSAVLAVALERGVAEGCFGPVDVEAAAQMLYAVVHAAADAVLAGGERGRWISACIALARSYLSPPAQWINTGRPSAEGTPPV